MRSCFWLYEGFHSLYACQTTMAGWKLSHQKRSNHPCRCLGDDCEFPNFYHSDRTASAEWDILRGKNNLKTRKTKKCQCLSSSMCKSRRWNLSGGAYTDVLWGFRPRCETLVKSVWQTEEGPGIDLRNAQKWNSAKLHLQHRRAEEKRHGFSSDLWGGEKELSKVISNIKAGLAAIPVIVYADVRAKSKNCFKWGASVLPLLHLAVSLKATVWVKTASLTGNGGSNSAE